MDLSLRRTVGQVLQAAAGLLGVAGVLVWLANEGEVFDFVPDNAELDRPPGWGPGKHELGERVVWHGVTLVCCTAHTAVEGMEHPWETIGWEPRRAAALWAPDGDVEAARLVSLVESGLAKGLERPEMLEQCALIAAGHES